MCYNLLLSASSVAAEDPSIIMEAQLVALGISEENAKAYAAKFASEAVSLDDIRACRIGSNELSELGVKMGDRQKLLTLATPPSAPSQPVMVASAPTGSEKAPLLGGGVQEVRVSYQLPPGIPQCVNHPGVPANYQCIQRNCRRNFCLNCVSLAPPRYIHYWCHACRDHVKANALCDAEKCAIL